MEHTSLFFSKEAFGFKRRDTYSIIRHRYARNGWIEAATHLRESDREIKIIMLTGKQERFKEVFKIGAYRFVTKPVDRDELHIRTMIFLNFSHK